MTHAIRDSTSLGPSSGDRPRKLPDTSSCSIREPSPVQSKRSVPGRRRTFSSYRVRTEWMIILSPWEPKAYLGTAIARQAVIVVSDEYRYGGVVAGESRRPVTVSAFRSPTDTRPLYSQRRRDAR